APALGRSGRRLLETLSGWFRRGGDALVADGVPRRDGVAHAPVRGSAGEGGDTRVLVLLHARAALCPGRAKSESDAHGGNPVRLQPSPRAARLSRRELARAVGGVGVGARAGRKGIVVLGELRPDRRPERPGPAALAV